MITFPYDPNSLHIYRIENMCFPEGLFIRKADEFLREYGINDPSLFVMPIKDLFQRYGCKDYDVLTMWIPPLFPGLDQTKLLGTNLMMSGVILLF
jgi:hypothetical protein